MSSDLQANDQARNSEITFSMDQMKFQVFKCLFDEFFHFGLQVIL